MIALAATAAPPTKEVPSNPSRWDRDFLSMAAPSPTCPGGSLESLRKHMAVSAPYAAPDAFQAATHHALPTLIGVVPSDRYYSFSFRSDLPGGGFWGFGGYLITRGSCIIHAEVTSRDN
jgi:hypothetical protein